MLHSRAFTLTSYSTTSIKSNHRPTAYNKSMLHFLKGFVFSVLMILSFVLFNKKKERKKNLTQMIRDSRSAVLN